MADIEVPKDSPSGSFYPQDFNLEALNIITDSNQKFNIRNLLIELSFFEDIYSFVTSGHIILKDAVGLVEKLKMDGSEFIEVSYSKMKSQPDAASLDRTFRIYKIGDRKPVGNLTTEYITLYFCTELLLLSEQTKISKGYVGKKIATSLPDNSGIINNILTEKLKLSSKRIKMIEETYGTYDFVIPRMKPLEAISWLSTYARPAGNSMGSDMVFYETKDGFYYRSLQSILKDPPYATYKSQVKNVDLDPRSVQENFYTILDYEIIKGFDVLESTSSGLYANRLISIDPLTKSYKVTNFNYEEYQRKNGLKNTNGVINPSRNALGVKQTEAYDSSLKVVVGNSNQTSVDYIRERQGSTVKDIYVETYIPYRTAQLALANYTVLKMTVPGDSNLTVGRTLNVNILSLQNETNNTKNLDEFYSGKYLISAVRHVIQTQGVYQTVLEVVKQNVNSKYTQAISTNKNA